MTVSTPPEGVVHAYIAALQRYRPVLAERYYVASMGIFGSYIRNDQHATSDLDVLVSFDQTPSLFTLVALQDELSDLLGISVDVVMASSLKPHIGARILAEVVPV